MAENPCRWGILGAANIARKNWKAIRNAGNAVLTAVASRDRTRAQNFIDDCQTEASLKPVPVPATYEELLARNDVDAVYIPLPTGVRKEWVLRAAAAGKHVLCEKPCGVTVSDLRTMLEACRKGGVQFMDGVMFMHSNRLPLLRQAIDGPGGIGPVHRIVSQFTFKGGNDFLEQNIRASSALEPLGCLGDLGWYNVRFSLWVMGEQLPERATGHLLADHKGVPLSFSGELFFPGAATASFYCSFRTENQQWANVSGERGFLNVPDFVIPFFGCEAGFEVNAPIFRVRGCDFNMESHPRRFAAHEYSSGTPEAQETNMIRTFSGIVASGKLEPSWGEIALKTQQVIEACLHSAREGGKAVPVNVGR